MDLSEDDGEDWKGVPHVDQSLELVQLHRDHHNGHQNVCHDHDSGEAVT
jgi:hypothetical protein